MLDPKILSQVREVLGGLSTSFTFVVERDAADEKSAENSRFVEEVASCSPKLDVVYRDGAGFRFSILRDGQETGISFRGIPSGHEFTSLLLVLLNGDGKGRNLPDDAITARIRALSGDIHLTTYVSLTCTNCPDVVQALNIMALLNPSITHETVDGAVCRDEVERHNIQAVPSVYMGGELLHVGRGTLGGLLEEIEDKLGVDPIAGVSKAQHSADILVLGGGPAGAAAAIYAARKGQSVALVARRIGGQVNDTTAIENIISVPQTTGSRLAADLANGAETDTGFSDAELSVLSKLAGRSVRSSSFGRFLDALAYSLEVCRARTYDGEPAMKLEHLLARGHLIDGIGTETVRGEIQTAPLFLRLGKADPADEAYSAVQLERGFGALDYWKSLQVR